MLVPTFACDWFWWFNQLLGVVSHVSYYCYCNLKYDALSCLQRHAFVKWMVVVCLI